MECELVLNAMEKNLSRERGVWIPGKQKTEDGKAERGVVSSLWKIPSAGQRFGTRSGAGAGMGVR